MLTTLHLYGRPATALQGLEAFDSQFKKSSEDVAKELKRYASKLRKAFDKALKGRVAGLKKVCAEENLAMEDPKQAKQATKLQVESFIEEQWIQFEKESKELVGCETRVHETRQGELRMQTVHRLKVDVAQLQHQLLKERLELIKEQKTGSLQRKSREHCIELHALRARHQSDRHVLERKLLEESHKAVTKVIEKNQVDEGKTLKKTLRRKVPEVRKTVLAAPSGLQSHQETAETTEDTASLKAGSPLRTPSIRCTAIDVRSDLTGLYFGVLLAPCQHSDLKAARIRAGNNKLIFFAVLPTMGR